MLKHCWMKLNGQGKWQASVANSLKTAMANEDEGGDPAVPTQEGLAPTKKVIRNRGESGMRRRSEKGWRPR